MTSLEYAIRYDVEHDLFHPQNVFSDEYITPTFVEYVRKLEQKLEQTEKDLADYQFNYPTIKELEKENADQKDQLAKARGLLRAWFQYCIDTEGKTPLKIETAQFLQEIEK